MGPEKRFDKTFINAKPILAATVTALVLGTSIAACKRKFGAGGKSFVGLSARVSGGGAPSFDAVSRWFQAALAAPGDAGATALSDTPPQLRDGLVAYAMQQVQRIKDFQGAGSDRRRLEQLLDRETQDLLELIVTLVDPGIRPECSSDILVKLVAQPGLRELMDQAAQDPLDAIFATDRNTLQREMPAERANYLRNLTRAYIDPATGAASPALAQDLRRNCAWLTNFLTKAGWPLRREDACEADPQVVSSGDAPLFFRLFDNAVRAMAASGDWMRRNPNVNPYGLRADGPLRVAGGFPFVRPLAPDWYRERGPAPERLNCFAAWAQPTPDSNRTLPSGACDRLRGTPAFVSCMRHLDDLVPMASLLGPTRMPPMMPPMMPPVPFPDWSNPIPPQSRPPWRNDSVPPPRSQFPTSNVPLGLQAKQAFVDARRQSGETNSNTLFLTTFAPPILDQGREGACTAYAAVGSGEAAVNPARQGRGPNFDPQAQWIAQCRSTSYNNSLDTAKATGVHGGSKEIATDAGALKSALDSGYPVYAGCGTQGWSGAFGSGGTYPTVRCGKQGQYGHAFWIGGYTQDESGGISFMVRNSWGAGWGNQGVGLIPGEDVSNFSMAYAVDAGPGVQSAGGCKEGRVSNDSDSGPTIPIEGEEPTEEAPTDEAPTDD